MVLAGIPVRDEDVRELAELLRASGFEDVAHKLEHALLIETKILALSIVDRESILRALDDPRLTHSPSSVVCCSQNTSGGCAKGSCSSASPSRPEGGGFIKTFDEGSAPRSGASLEPGEGTRSRPDSERLAAARPVAIGVGSDYSIELFRTDRLAIDEPPTDALAEPRGVLLVEHEWRVREGLVPGLV